MNQASYTPTERRPIKSRETRWAASVTDLLVKLGATPNSISIFGMLAAILAGGLFYSTSRTDQWWERLLWLVAASLCQVRLLCNLFDGMVAVKRGIASRRGELFNEIPDRISDAAVFIGLGYADGGQPSLGYLAALLSVFVAYVRAAAKSIGAPNDFCGPMAKPQRMALATALSVYMALTPSGWRWAWGEVNVILLIVIAGGVVTAWRRMRRAARFLSTQPDPIRD